MSRALVPIPIVITVPDAAWHDVTAEFTTQMEAYGLEPEAFYFVGVHARSGAYDGFLSFRAENDNKAFKIPSLVQWDAMGHAIPIGSTGVHLRSTNAGGDTFEFLLAQKVKENA